MIQPIAVMEGLSALRDDIGISDENDLRALADDATDRLQALLDHNLDVVAQVRDLQLVDALEAGPAPEQATAALDDARESQVVAANRHEHAIHGRLARDVTQPLQLANIVGRGELLRAESAGPLRITKFPLVAPLQAR